MIGSKQDRNSLRQSGPSVPTAKALIQIRDLRKSFGSHAVLRGFSLTLYEQENLVIVGKSGSGKSVLLKCIVKLDKPDSGELFVLGKNVPQLSKEEMDILRADIGFLFQGSALYDSMTVRENLEFPLRRHQDRIRDENMDELIEQALHNVGLSHAIDLMPEELSGGMKRRVALARAVILRPKIILYDEPSSGLDPITSREISKLILNIQNIYKTASLIITHDIDFGKSIANRFIVLRDGIDYATGTYNDLVESTDPNIKAFFNYE
ncbi:MAG: ATP-binding cassette domain-containing protein [Saprospiraceae bacterium]|nr:ATP-binding cassette domain-containing protein [Saprospiraceae bacterium]